MANKDGIVSIGFDYKKELDEVCATIEKEFNSLGGDINLSDGIKKQMTEIKKMIADMKKDIGSSFDKITETKLDTKTFESFKKDVNKRIREINKEVTTLKEQFSTLDGSANVNGIVQQFANLKKYVEDSNASISELISNSEKLGKSVNLKNVSSNLKGNIDDIKKQIDSLERSLNVLDGNGMTSYKNKSVEKLKEDIIELVTNFDNVQNEYKVIFETLNNTDKTSPLFTSLEKQAIEYELKLAEILTRIETIRNEIDNKGIEKYEKQLVDYNNRKIVKTKSDGSVEYAKEPNYPSPIDLSDIIPLDIDKKIDELIDNGFESGVSKAKTLLSELRTELNSITNRPEKTELNGASNNIELHISTKQSTINKQLDEMIDNLQQRAANKPIIAPVKLRVDSEYEKTTKDASASALTENQINEARKDVESVVPGLEKAFNNSMRIATNKAVENAKESIKAVREFFKTNPITVHLTIPEDERLKIGKSILSEDGKTTVDISGQVDKARKSVKGLSEDLEKSQLLIKENAQNAKNLSLEKLVNSLSETMAQFSELKGIISSIQNMENTIARASGISSTNELVQQWSVVEKTIINATKLDGDFRKNANIGKIVSEYQKYIDMGGTNALSSIDKIKDNEATINSILSKMKELKSQDIENSSIQKLSVDLDGVIAKFDELISTVKTATNALYMIIKQGSISDLDKQWSSITNKFKSIADESGKINFSKQKKDVEELLVMYQRYVNMGGSHTPLDLTDNLEILAKLDKAYKKLNETKPIDNSSTIKSETESFRKVEQSVESLTKAIGDTKVQAINVEATAMEDAAEREIMAIISILDNLDLVVSRLKDIKGIKLPKIEVKNVDVVEKAVESLKNTGNKSNISSENSTPQIINQQEQLKEAVLDTATAYEKMTEAEKEARKSAIQAAVNSIPQAENTARYVHWGNTDQSKSILSNPNGMSTGDYGLISSFADCLGEAETSMEAIYKYWDSLHAEGFDKGSALVIDIPLDEVKEFERGLKDNIPQEYIKGFVDTESNAITLNTTLQNGLKETAEQAEKTSQSVQDISKTPIKDVFQGEKIDQATTSAKELDKTLEQVDIPTDSFDDVLSKLDLTESKLKEIVKITKQSISDSEGKFHDSYTLKDKRGSTEIYGLSSNTEKGQLLRSNIVGYDAKEIEQEAKAVQKLAEEKRKLRQQEKQSTQSSVDKALTDQVSAWKQIQSIREKIAKTNNTDEIAVLQESKKYYQEQYNNANKILKANDGLYDKEAQIARLEQVRLETNAKLASYKTKQVEQEKNILNNAQNKIDNANIDINKLSKRDVQSDAYVKAIENYKNAVIELQKYINNLNNNGIQSQDDIDELNRLQKAVDEASKSIKNMSASEKGTSIAKSSTVFLKIEELRDKYKGMSKDMQKELDRLERKFAGLGDTIDTGRAIGELKQFETQLIKTGTATNSLWSAMKDKAFYNFANQLGTMVSFYDLISLGRKGFQTIRELDTALTEMKKVSDETTQSLKNYQATTFDVGDAVGATAKTIQNSTADWMRLGRLQQKL